MSSEAFDRALGLGKLLATSATEEAAKAVWSAGSLPISMHDLRKIVAQYGYDIEPSRDNSETVPYPMALAVMLAFAVFMDRIQPGWSAEFPDISNAFVGAPLKS